MEAKPENIVDPSPSGSVPRLVRLVPGNGWTRIGANVWEDVAGNRVIPNMGINAIALRPCGGETRFLHTHEEPLKAALRRNGNKRRAGLAAAKAYFAEANDEMRDGERKTSANTTDAL